MASEIILTAKVAKEACATAVKTRVTWAPERIC